MLFFIFIESSYSLSREKELDSLIKTVRKVSGDDKMNTLFRISKILRDESKYEETLPYLKMMMDEAKKMNNPVHLGSAWNEKGLYYENSRNWEEAMKCYLKAYELEEKAKNRVMMGVIDGNIANIYRMQRNYDLAEKYYKKSIFNLTRSDRKDLIANANGTLGNLYYDLNELDKALNHYQIGLNYYMEFDSTNYVQIATWQNNIGSVLNDLGRHDEALERYKLSLAMNTKIGDRINTAMCHANIGNVYNEMGQPEKALPYLETALQLSKDSKADWLIMNIYIYFIEGYRISGDLESAIIFQDSLMNLKDRMYDLQSNANIAEMQTKFDTEKKERENELLKKEGDLKDLDLNRQQILIYSVVVILILLIIVSVFIYRSYRIKSISEKRIIIQNRIIEEKAAELADRQKEILDSITYAQYIQAAILPSIDDINKSFTENFLLYQPKDIVAGDFYFLEKTPTHLFYAAADCTGHGVPGAMMSVVCSNALNRAIHEFNITEPGKILDKTRELVLKTFEHSGNEVKDGMDISLVSLAFRAKNESGSEEQSVNENGGRNSSLSLSTLTLFWSGANNPIWILRHTTKTIEEIKGDSMHIGLADDLTPFTTHEIKIEKGDIIYIFTDGYSDQFGGEKGKKFKLSSLKQILLQHADQTLEKQKEILLQKFNEWKGSLEQIDDVCVIGIRL